MAGDEGRQLAVGPGEALLGGQRLDGELAHQVGGGPLAGDGEALGVGGGRGGLGQAPGLAQVRPSPQVLEQPGGAGGADLGRGHVARERVERAPGGDIQGALEAGVDGAEQLT
ncbi:MAG TPA: hypothetical protein VFG47_02635, partial [Geminicoccaceae bacterium]|nr:hypothetical protein [Geminicoccaceae bacterium]